VDWPDRAAPPESRTPARTRSTSPLVQIPVQPEDVARRRRRIVIQCCSAAALLIAAAAAIYQHNVDPIHSRESYNDGVAFFKVARYNQAILTLDRAVGLRPEFADGYLLRGRAYVREYKTEPAIDDFTRVLDLRSNDTQALLNRALAYMDLNDYRSAIADADTALRIDPTLSQAYNVRGMAVRTLGDWRKALQDFTRAVEIDPNIDNYYQRASTYQLLGEHRLGIDDLNQVIKFLPDGSPAYFARARSRQAIGDLRGARADHRRGILIETR
jgi:tetratricopeptide (TPR) repeat protein